MKTGFGSTMFLAGLAVGAVLLPAAQPAVAQGVTLLPTIDGRGGVRLDGEATNNGLGAALSGAGDVNGDGIADVIVGSTNQAPNGAYSGAAYVVYGRAGGQANLNLSAINGTNGFRLNGAAASDGAGYSVAGAGDVNGDGFADVIVGAQGTDSNGSGSGSAYVVYGGSAIPTAVNLFSINGTNGFRVDGSYPNYEAGYSVAGAGDVNGDGLADVMVGSRRAAANGEYSGSTAIVFGQPTGDGASTYNVSALNGVTGFRLEGEAASDYSGSSVAAAGDVNGDGFGDMLVGAFDVTNGSLSDSGTAYVVFGKADWSTSAVVQLSSINGINGFRLNGGAANDQAAASVSGAGDVNGDGFDDVIVGAHATDFHGSGSGSAYVVYGKADWSASPAVLLSSLNGATGFRMDGPVAGYFFGSSVSGLGDVNGDSLSDVAVGSYFAGFNGTYSGSTYVVYGRTGAWPAVVQLSSINGANGFRMDGSLQDRSGSAIAGAGDFNGDGLGDVLVSAELADWSGTESGSAYIVFGSSAQRATFSGRSVAGNSPKAAVDVNYGSQEPGSRVWLDFNDGTASIETVHLTRTRDALVNLNPLTDVGRTIWDVSTNRTGWNTCRITLKYTDGEIAGIAGGEGSLHIYRAPTPSGPWTGLITTRQPGLNQVSADTSVLAFFAISGTTPPSASVPAAEWSLYQ